MCGAENSLLTQACSRHGREARKINERVEKKEIKKKDERRLVCHMCVIVAFSTQRLPG